MRSRFLATDYFAPSPSATASADRALALASLPFHPLPVPTLPPDPHLSTPFSFPAAADLLHLPAVDVAGDDLNSLPVASALSAFLAAVVPRHLPVPDIPAADEGLDDYLYDRGGNGKDFSSAEPTSAFGIPKGLDEISGEKVEKEEGSSLGISTVMKPREPLKELSFEVVEVDILPDLQRKIASLGGEAPGGGVTFYFGVPDVKIHLDFIGIDTETTITYPTELVDSIYQVDKIPVKHDIDEECSYARDSYCLELAGLDHGVMIPELEVSRNSWELDECPAKAAISNIFLDVIKNLHDGAQVQHSGFDSTEFLRSPDMDVLAVICKDAPHVDYQPDKPITAKDVAEMDLVRINDNILLERNSALYPLKPDGTCSDFPCSVLLEEVEITDLPCNDVFKTIVQSEKAKMDTSDEMFKHDFDQAKCFYESVVSSELTLVDDTFKSLPTPILTDDKAMRSILPPIEEVLSSLKPLPLSAADGIYLDWHLISEGPCNREICSTYAIMVEEVKPCGLSSEPQISCQQTSALGIDFLEDFQRSAKLEHEDKQNEIYVTAPASRDPPANLGIAQKYKQESESKGHKHMEKLTPEKSSSVFESMPRSNGLNFFLDGGNGTKRVTTNENVSTLDIPSSKQQAVPFSARPKFDKLIEIHPVSLSDLIRGLIKDIYVSYTSALRESGYCRRSFSDGQCLSISKQKLLELITGESSEGAYNKCKHQDKMELIVLYALKQVAYYLCFFGLHAAHLYVGNLIGSVENIPERLRNIQCFIDEARLEADKQLLESHPSLSDIETILRSNAQMGQKILIIADRAFWLPLGQKLISMKITSVELENAIHPDLVSKMNSKTWVLEELWKSDCILLDNKNIPASFPFSEFGIILEYGGPNKSSNLLSMAPKLDGLPPLHFLYVKVDDEDFPVALVEDNDTDQDLRSTLDAVLHTLQKDLQEKMKNMRIVDSLNFVPATNHLQHLQDNLSKHLSADSSKKLTVDGQLHNQGNTDQKNIVGSHKFVPAADQLETLNKITIVNSQKNVPVIEKSSSTSSVSANVMKAPQDNQSASDFAYGAQIDSIKPERLSSPEAVVVVNTGNSGKNMLFSRRSSYQQILALEKGGTQVVERDVDLPVDLILSASVCLVWYETRTLASELTQSAVTSGITNFVEDIATNLLMSLSFSFSTCIMVFEGENHFLSAVMDSSDSLYASAASLDMNLQLFFSQTPKSTDQIILSCIGNANRINQAPTPDITESASLAESFLTAFPSINPLSAHMILSSGSLLDFLSWSYEQRIQAVEKYLLPPQSISLFSALCKFGELGESRSVMTECSSADSDISSAFLQSPRKKKKRALQDFSVAVNDPLCPNPLNQLRGDHVEDDKIFSPPKLRKFSHTEDTMPELPEVFMFDQSLNMGSQDVFYEPRKHDVNAVTGNQMIDDDFSNGLAPNLGRYNDRTSSMVDTYNISWQAELEGKQAIKSAFPTSRPSFYPTHSHPVFPTALEINNKPGDWDMSCDTNPTRKGHLHGDFTTISCRNDLGSRYHEPREEIMQNPASSLAFLKQDFGSHAASQGSGWEIDYLRQMNEQRRARQERSRYNVSATLSDPRIRDRSSRIHSAPPIDSFRYQGNVDTPSKHRSPSSGTQRYGKSREGIKAQSHRVRKDFKVQPSRNHEKSLVPSIDPTWTPVDKRARQKLSFATYGKEKQSKLVWRSQNSPGVGCGFRKRYRQEGT
ncbi:hypothetical protein ACP70R_026560 [Stipagrostis hirtigluma subsp. patula]